MANWTPNADQERRADFTRANERARRLRKALTPAEAKLWRLLRVLSREGANFRKQAQVGGYVFDFADLSAKLLLEVDGGVHALAEVAARDEKKEVAARNRGYRVLRLSNATILHSPDDARESVRQAWRPSPFRGEGREGGRPTPRTRNKSSADTAARAAEDEFHPERPLPPPPPPGAGEER